MMFKCGNDQAVDASQTIGATFVDLMTFELTSEEDV